MARHQRPRRLRVWDDRRTSHAPPPRPAGGRSADACGTHGAPWPSVGARPPADRRVVVLTDEERVGALDLAGARSLIEFRLEDGLPVWLYDLGGITLEKRVLMPHHQNTVYIRYAVTRG